MNIRNLLLAAIIFCVSPIVCAMPSANLTKQEQEVVKEWAKKIKSGFSESQQTLKTSVSMVKDYFSFALNNIAIVGRNRAECSNEMIEAYEIFSIRAHAEDRFKALEKKISSKTKVSKDVSEEFQKPFFIEMLPDIRFERREGTTPEGITIIEESIFREIMPFIYIVVMETIASDGVTTTTLSFDTGESALIFQKIITEDAEVVISNVGVITTEDVIKMKKMLALSSFAVECL